MEAEYLKMDTETQAQYERRVKQMRDAKNVEDYMIETSIAKGLKQGLEQGREQGREETIALTVKACSMIKEGHSTQEICEATGLSEDYILQLQEFRA